MPLSRHARGERNTHVSHMKGVLAAPVGVAQPPGKHVWKGSRLAASRSASDPTPRFRQTVRSNPLSVELSTWGGVQLSRAKDLCLSLVGYGFKTHGWKNISALHIKAHEKAP